MNVFTPTCIVTMETVVSVEIIRKIPFELTVRTDDTGSDYAAYILQRKKHWASLGFLKFCKGPSCQERLLLLVLFL